MHTTNEQKIIKLFMAVIFLALFFVYILLFQVKGSAFKGTTTTTSGDIQISVMSGDQEQTLTPIDEQREALALDTGDTVPAPNTGLTVLQPPVANTGSSSGSIIILSGTNIFYGTIESIEKLGIKYQYALVDDKNIYYINLGTPTYDFASIARKLGGNLYELKTELDIAKNKLFGDKITFINLPEYKEKRTLMLIYIKDQTWLIQMDYAIYHKSKTYLKSLFTQ